MVQTVELERGADAVANRAVAAGHRPLRSRAWAGTGIALMVLRGGAYRLGLRRSTRARQRVAMGVRADARKVWPNPSIVLLLDGAVA
jgi:hypothetical protein